MGLNGIEWEIPSALFNIAMKNNPFIDDKHDELCVKMVMFHSNVK